MDIKCLTERAKPQVWCAANRSCERQLERVPLAPIVGWIAFLALIVCFVVACGGRPALNPDIPVAGPEHARQLAEDQLRLNEIRVACLRARGLDATASARGVRIDHPGQPSDLVRTQIEECEEELKDQGLLPSDPMQIEGYLSDVYDYYISLADCLRQRGVVVGDTPTRESFIESTGNWNPYQYVDPNDIDTLEAECPQSMQAS